MALLTLNFCPENGSFGASSHSPSSYVALTELTIVAHREDIEALFRVLMNTNNCDANYYIDYIRPYTSYDALEYIGVNLTVIIVSSKDQK